MKTDSIDLTAVTTQGLVVGQPTALNTITEFVNLRCPFCRTWFEKATPVLEPLIKAGKLKRIFKFWDKPKEILRIGNVAQHYLPYEEPTQAYHAIKFLFAHQTDWQNLTPNQLADYMNQQLQLTEQPNATVIQQIKNEVAAAQIETVPTIILGQHIFDEHISSAELKQLLTQFV